MENKENTLIIKHHNKNVVEFIFNNPKRLNAMDNYSVLRIHKHILKYLPDDVKEAECIDEEDVDIPQVIIFKGAGNVFCAGADVKETYNLLLNNDIDKVVEYNREELALCYGLTIMEPKQVVIWNGYVMGTGAGISINAPVRIATESTVFAMPETAIGMYPDVGAAFFLPRLLNNNYEIALYVGLSGHRMLAKELLVAGIATHYVRNENIEAMEQTIIDKLTNANQLEAIIEPFVEAKYDPLKFEFPNSEIIKKVFILDSVDNVFDRLEYLIINGDAFEQKFAKETHETLSKMSPIAMVVFLEFMKRAQNFTTIKEAYEIENKIFNKYSHI
jgi:3-hydroxyisobutyryl-CoA hydrolase